MSQKRYWLAFVGCIIGLFGSAGPLVAQPDVCTVSVLNQTAHVQADGSWAIPNVPANMGPVRARVNCVSSGTTSTGTSPFFTVNANRTSAIQTVDLGNKRQDSCEPLAQRAPCRRSPPLPKDSPCRLWRASPMGSIENVTSADSGTIYTSTNPAIASVDANGMVTAHASGRVLIMALHEAILASVGGVCAAWRRFGRRRDSG